MQDDSSYDIVFYDGECGMCHGLVSLILPRDKSARFRFAPLQGETFAGVIAPEKRAGLHDSVAIMTASGKLLVRSDATIYVLRLLGGFYKPLASLLRLFPKRLRDWTYDFIARRRKVWFAKPQTLCPIVPEQLRPRFLP
jgi:predicted DCC family thiol-disulfide oxidoreductase YuxK